ncbi:MAG: hypothetical protein Q4D33_13125 [Prevotellaceae bacterium]|nr:hypothetical protein [Prevotellaceae bacterium]
MNKENIKNILIERGYSVAGAETASADLVSISDSLKPLLESWLSDGMETDYESNGITVKGIMAKFGMKYPAALLSVDWVIRDPKTAIAVIKRGLR